jgi:hypothetical protein
MPTPTAAAQCRRASIISCSAARSAVPSWPRGTPAATQPLTATAISAKEKAMAKQLLANYRFLVKELAQPEEGEAPVGIVCEPLSSKPGVADCGAISMRLKPGTTVEEAREIASYLQAKVRGLCHIEGSD